MARTRSTTGHRPRHHANGRRHRLALRVALGLLHRRLQRRHIMVMTGGAVRYGARVARLVARVLGLTATEGHEPNNDNNKDRETSNPRSVPLRTLSLTHPGSTDERGVLSGS